MDIAQPMAQVVTVLLSLEPDDRIYLLSRLLAVQCVHDGRTYTDCRLELDAALCEATRGILAQIPDPPRRG